MKTNMFDIKLWDGEEQLNNVIDSTHLRNI